jgi:hypothetical protein
VYVGAIVKVLAVAFASWAGVKMYRHARELLRLRREARRRAAVEKLQWLKRKLEAENGHDPGFYG